MKASAFPKLDRPPRRKREPKPRASTAIDQSTWIAWRMKLGASRKAATKLWADYQEWLAQEATNGPVRRLEVAPWQNWEREFRAFLDEMPRKPYAFLARVAAADKRRAMLAVVRERKAKNRERYERQYARRA